MASIFPSIPRSPNPPGTTIPSTCDNSFWIVSFSSLSESIQCTRISVSYGYPACFRDSTQKDKHLEALHIYQQCQCQFFWTNCVLYRLILSTHPYLPVDNQDRNDHMLIDPDAAPVMQ